MKILQLGLMLWNTKGWRKMRRVATVDDSQQTLLLPPFSHQSRSRLGLLPSYPLLQITIGDHENPQEHAVPNEGGLNNFAAFLQGLNDSYGTALQQNAQAVQQMGATIGNFMQQQQQQQRPSRGPGPKPREPKPYDGDRSNGKLDDHIRDLTNWVEFHDRRGQWNDETEKVTQAATYLEGKMHRMFEVHRNNIHLFPEYITWLRATFKDVNENQKLKDEWQQCLQGNRSVHDYSTELVHLRARITPLKSDEEVKEHLRTGLRGALQLALAEHPNWDSLPLPEFIGRADRLDQIEAAKESVRRRTGGTTYGQSYALTGPPARRRGAVITSAGPSVKPSKGTEEWKKHCISNNLCFNCGKAGHGARNCSQTRDTSSHRRGPPPRRGGRFTRGNNQVQGKATA